MSDNAFTDEDLARIKAACLLSIEEYGNQDGKDILRLIIRLEAAELALEHFIDSTPVSDERTRLDDECDEWRKEAGK